MLASSQFTYFDNCLAYADSSSYLSVRSLSPCTKNLPTSTAPGTSTTALLDLGTFMSSTWSQTANYGGVYGIAKDGHVIYGPYNSNGELWSCEDLDACNGFFLIDGSYGYATT